MDEIKNNNGADRIRNAAERIGGIRWKGIGEEAIRKMGKDELIEYTNLLERTILSVHRHFYYFSPNINPMDRTASFENIGFDGNTWDVAIEILQASLRMYEVHATPFVPVQVPKGAPGIRRISKPS